jgi:hypothetical protein
VALWGEGQAQAQGLYMKDFHFLLQRDAQQPESALAPAPAPYYAVPPPLDDDWLNEWWDAADTDDTDEKEGKGKGKGRRRDDYRFLYLGPAGSRTPLHHDVLCSYSWSANLAGRKRWRLFHPCHTPRLFLRPPDAAAAVAGDQLAAAAGAGPTTLVADADSPLLAGQTTRTGEKDRSGLLLLLLKW